MTRRSGTVCLLAVLVAFALTTVIVAGEKSWVLTKLPGPSGKTCLGTFPNDLSDSGYIGGAWIDSDGVMRGAYWRKGNQAIR